MTKKTKKKLLIILLLILILCGWGYYKWNFTGSRSGKVVDAVTGKPVEGAVVCMYWEDGGFMTIIGSDCTALYETKTDSEGRYTIPNLRVSKWSWFDGVGHEQVMIYKDKYCGYEVSRTDLKPVGRSFGHKEEEQSYRKKRNIVQLYPFKESDSHQDHLNWIHTFGIYDWPEQLLEKELQNEMERETDER